MTIREMERSVPTDSDSRLHCEIWGSGTPVVLVHGSLATGAEEWVTQQPLAGAGFCLQVIDRRGYGRSPGAAGEDYLVDADDIAELLGDGAHLVGHSYGGLGALLAAARRPGATRSLTVLEPAVAAAGRHDARWRQVVAGMEVLWGLDLPDSEWVVRFLRAAGSDPDQFPPEMLAATLPLVPVLRHGRAFFDQAAPPLAELAAARFPKLVVSGGHHPGFEAMCTDLADRIRGRHAVVAGAGHEIQFVGEPLNAMLLDLWRSTSS